MLSDCCGLMMKFPDCWEYIKHLVEKHGYSEQAAKEIVLETEVWKVA